MAGLERRKSGSVRIKGKLVEGTSAAAARGAGIGFVTDDRHEEGLFLTLRLRDNIGIGALDRISTAGVIDRKRDYALTREVMERLGVYTGYRVKEHDDTTAAELSGGNQQKMLIGREIAGDPEVILIDEPTKGVDVGARAEIYERLRELAVSGVALVVSSSDGIELAGLCDRVVVFARGQIVKELEGESLTDAAITEANMTARVAREGGPTRKEKEDEGWRRIMAADRFPAAVLAVLTAIVLFGTNSISEYFLSAFNIETMLTFLSILAFISIAQLGTILVGRIDLSVGALAGFVVVLASFLTPDGGSAAKALRGSVLILAITAAFGLVQGWLVTWLNIPAIVVTLATFIGLQGLSLELRPEAAGTVTDDLSDVTQWTLAGMPACFLASWSSWLRLNISCSAPGSGGGFAPWIQSARRDAGRHSGQPANPAGFHSVRVVEWRRWPHSRGAGRHRFARHRHRLHADEHHLRRARRHENRRRARLGPVRLDGRGPCAIAVERVVLHQSGFRDPSDRARRRHDGCRHLLQRRTARENRVEPVSTASGAACAYLASARASGSARLGQALSIAPRLADDGSKLSRRHGERPYAAMSIRSQFAGRGMDPQ